MNFILKSILWFIFYLIIYYIGYKFYNTFFAGAIVGIIGIWSYAIILKEN